MPANKLWPQWTATPIRPPASGRQMEALCRSWLPCKGIWSHQRIQFGLEKRKLRHWYFTEGSCDFVKACQHSQTPHCLCSLSFLLCGLGRDSLLQAYLRTKRRTWNESDQRPWQSHRWNGLNGQGSKVKDKGIMLLQQYMLVFDLE